MWKIHIPLSSFHRISAMSHPRPRRPTRTAAPTAAPPASAPPSRTTTAAPWPPSTGAPAAMRPPPTITTGVPEVAAAVAASTPSRVQYTTGWASDFRAWRTSCMPWAGAGARIRKGFEVGQVRERIERQKKRTWENKWGKTLCSTFLFLLFSGSLGTREHHGVSAAGAPTNPAVDMAKSSHTSPTKTCSRGSSKKSNHSVLFTNGKLDGTYNNH